MKTLKTILGLILLLTLTTSCTDLSEDLELYDTTKTENVTDINSNTNQLLDTGGAGDADGTDKDW